MEARGVEARPLKPRSQTWTAIRLVLLRALLGGTLVALTVAGGLWGDFYRWGEVLAYAFLLGASLGPLAVVELWAEKHTRPVALGVGALAFPLALACLVAAIGEVWYVRAGWLGSSFFVEPLRVVPRALRQLEDARVERAFVAIALGLSGTSLLRSVGAPWWARWPAGLLLGFLASCCFDFTANHVLERLGRKDEYVWIAELPFPETQLVGNQCVAPGLLCDMRMVRDSRIDLAVLAWIAAADPLADLARAIERRIA